jgi:O-methyltransferase
MDNNSGSLGQSWFEEFVRSQYVHWIRPHIRTELARQRFKCLWDSWGYLPIFFIKNISFSMKLKMIIRSLDLDFHLVHGHKPHEIMRIFKELSKRPVAKDEIFLEAGCWQGGSSAKFSLMCKSVGCKLHVYDSFQGVKPMTKKEKAGFDFSGLYASSQKSTMDNIKRFGDLSVCEFHPGWFEETLGKQKVAEPIRLAYVDCDAVEGTKAALKGIVPALVSDGVIFSQDFHIPVVRQLLLDMNFWEQFQKGRPVVKILGKSLICFSFNS